MCVQVEVQDKEIARVSVEFLLDDCECRLSKIWFLQLWLNSYMNLFG